MTKTYRKWSKDEKVEEILDAEFHSFFDLSDMEDRRHVLMIMPKDELNQLFKKVHY